MSADQSKEVMARNIKRFMEKKGVTNQQLCDDLGFKYTTFMDWIKGVTYPRIGKVEAMANYFGCEKSDLIEDKKEPTVENDGLKSIGYYNLTQENQEMVAALIEKLLKSQSNS